MRWADALLLHPRRLNAAVFVGVLTVYLVTATWDFPLHIDTHASSFPAWWFTQNGTLDLTGATTPNPWIVETGNGLRSNRLPGAILINIPAYAIAGSSTFIVAPSAITASVVSAAAVTLMFMAMRGMLGVRLALLAAMVLAFGTGTWTVSADMAWGHGPAQLGIALGLYGASRRRYLLGGAGFAWAILTRPHTAVIAACVGLAESWEQRTWRPAIGIGVTSFLGVIGLVTYHRITLDQWSLLGSYSANADAALAPVARDWTNDLAGLFVAPERGILVYSAFLLLLVPGLPRAWRCAPAWVRGAAVGGVLYMVLQLAGNVVDGGSGYYSYRYPLEALTAFTPLLALAAQQWTLRDGPRRWVFFGLVSLAVAIHALGAYTYGTDGLPPRLWDRFAPKYVLLEASPSQVLATVATTLLLLAVMRALWTMRSKTRPASSRAGGSGSAPDAPTTTPAEPIGDPAPPSSASRRDPQAAR